MRLWIEHLLSNTPACDDFVKYMSENVERLAEETEKALFDGKDSPADKQSAVKCACERHMYKELLKQIQSYQREQVSQARYQQLSNVIIARKE